MFRQAGMAAVLSVALSFAPGRANDPGPSFGEGGARCSFPLDGRLCERLRLTGHASFGRYDVWAKRVKGQQVLDVFITHRGDRGEVDFCAQAATMDLWSHRDVLIVRLKGGRARWIDGTEMDWEDRAWTWRLP
jgi:hypothetical protein